MGTVLYVADSYNHRIRAIDLKSTVRGEVVVETVAGSGDCGYLDGVGTAAEFKFPQKLAYNSDDHVLYVSDLNDWCVPSLFSSFLPLLSAFFFFFFCAVF